MSSESMTLIRGVTAITMDPERRVVFDGAILIAGRRIVAVDREEMLATASERAEVIDARGMVAIPGLIDTHAHADQSLLRGLGDDLHWVPFLRDVINPYIGGRSAHDVVVAYRLSMLEMLRSGTTCFVSPNVAPHDDLAELTDAIAEFGIRAVLARYVTPTGEAEDGTAGQRGGLDEAAEAISRWDGGRDARINLWFGLHTPRLSGDDFFPAFYPAVSEQARELGARIVYHFASEIEDAEYYEQTFGMRPVEWARENDALGDNVLLINCCQVSAAEIDLLAATGTHVAHSPVANMKMATGVAPLPELLAAGINVSLGTDGGANNNSYDMIGEMKAACLLQNVTHGRAASLTAEQALELATIGGARSVGREHELGSLEAGKNADVVLVDFARPNTTPVLDPVSNLVYSAHPGNVDTVIVDGQPLVRGGSVIGVDEAAIVAEAQAVAERLAAERLQRPSPWQAEPNRPRQKTERH